MLDIRFQFFGPMTKSILMECSPKINDENNLIPANTIVVVPSSFDEEKIDYKDFMFSLVGENKRDWFNSHFYYCLPLTIGNQYGFAIKSTKKFTAMWDGGQSKENTHIRFFEDTDPRQTIVSHFGSGIITIQNPFTLRTPPNINLMTIQPPNIFIPGLSSMTGVIETDNLRRDFTFNLKITIPNFKITVNAGDIIAAFLPIPRNFVEKFDIKHVRDIFSKEMHLEEINASNEFGKQRFTEDKEKPHEAGRKYFKGLDYDNSEYIYNHQKTL
jgi:hypothetical protein